MTKAGLDIQSRVVEALAQIVSRGAAVNLLQRALGQTKTADLTPKAWAEFIEGPLQRELAQILPMGRLIPPLQALVQELKKQSPAVETPLPIPVFPTLEITTEYVRLSNPLVRQELVLELAREEGVTGVVLQTPYGLESRLAGQPGNLVALLAMSHRLLALKSGYRLFYTVLGEAQVVLRPLDHSWLAVLARAEANLGQLLYRLGKIEATREDLKGRLS